MTLKDYYRPQWSCGKVIFSQASVILSMGGGVSASVYAGIHPLQAETPPWAGTPRRAGTSPWQVHPLSGTSPGRYTPWEGTPPWQVHPQTVTAADGAHPTAFLFLYVAYFMSIEWNSIKLGGPAQGIVTNTAQKTLLGVTFCLFKTGPVAFISSQISFKIMGEVIYYLLFMRVLQFVVSMLLVVQDFRSKWGEGFDHSIDRLPILYWCFMYDADCLWVWSGSESGV